MIINTTINNPYFIDNKNIQINNYIYNPNYILGTGNFSKVHPAKNIITGKILYTTRIKCSIENH